MKTVQSIFVILAVLCASFSVAEAQRRAGPNGEIQQPKTLAFSWYSPERGDNFMTTDENWEAQANTLRRVARDIDYRMYRIEGLVFDPIKPQPAGTVPLYSWYSAKRGDNFVTSNRVWYPRTNNTGPDPNYRFVRKEGYIYSPDLPQPPRTVPLYSWYNHQRGDNFATTDQNWQGRPGEKKDGYGFARLEGYVGKATKQAIRKARLPRAIPPGNRDLDGDGLPDLWERRNASLGVDPRRADLIMYFAHRPDVNLSSLQPEIDKLKAFFADVPVQTIFGQRGINVVQQTANRLSNDFRSDADPLIRSERMSEAYDPAIPDEMKRYARGLFLSVGPGGGQATTGGKWGAAAANAPTMIHETGHLLGLCHEPNCATGQSPLYASLMNYAYAGGLGGDPANLQFSSGVFNAMRINERNTNETLPYGVEELQFLVDSPYDFDVRYVSPTRASVDFNRNSVHQESRIRADLNSGAWYGVGQDASWTKLGKTAGAIEIEAVGSFLVTLTTELPGINWDTHNEVETTDRRHALRATVNIEDQTIWSEIIAPPGELTGRPSAISHQNGLVLGYPKNDRLVLKRYSVAQGGLIERRQNSIEIGNASIELVSSPDGILVLRQSRDTGIVEVQRLTNSMEPASEEWLPIFRRVGEQPTAAQLESSFPVAGAWNSHTNQLLIVASASRENDLARVYSATPDPGASWRPEGWLTTSMIDTGFRTLTKPAFVFDGTDTGGANGRVFVFVRAELGTTFIPTPDQTRATDGRNNLFAARFYPKVNDLGGIERTDDPQAYVSKLLINIWTSSRSALSATLYGDDLALSWRRARNPLPGQPLGLNNDVELSFEGSGESYVGPADFDDLKYIAERGLRNGMPADTR